MKKASFIKGKLLLLALVTTVFLIASCDKNNNAQDSRDISREHNEEKFDNKKQKNDAEFVVKAAENNMAQIQLGQLAQQNGRTAHVKELGKTMENAHTSSQRDLSALANSKKISIPTATTNNTRKAYDDLRQKTGDDFDKAYTRMMVSDHKDAISSFEKAAKDSEDSEIKNWATATLPGLRRHLDRTIEVQKQFDDVMILEENRDNRNNNNRNN